jgi:molybdopterin-containing oxidoreductase family iron-sulfur binding subunit
MATTEHEVEEASTQDGRDLVSRRVFFGRAALTAGATIAAGSAALEGEAHADVMGDPAAPAGARVRRWAMIIDLRKCDGCTGLGVPPQCTQNCLWGRVVPDGMQWIQVFEQPSGTAGSAATEGGTPGYLPTPCMHCQNAPCANVCPVGATFQTPEGTVLIDQTRCIGCRICMAACPYDRRFFNWGTPDQPQWLEETDYDVQMQTPAKRGTVMKCDLCTDRLAAGGLPMCAKGCPNGAIYLGDLEEDIGTNGYEVIDMETFMQENNAYRYKEELGTEPRVWYIPGEGQGVVPQVASPIADPSQLEWIGGALAEWEKQYPPTGVTPEVD